MQRSAEDLSRVVRLVPGGRVLRTGSLKDRGGASFLTSKLIVKDGWAASRLLLEMSREDAADPEIRQVALTFRRDNGSDDRTARALHAFVRDTVLFVPEPVETFQSARYTLFSVRCGDCDDSARALFALAMAAGLRVRLAFLEQQGQPAHVWAQIYHDGSWHHAETTIAASYGEEPRAALARLGLGKGRRDVFGKEVITMGSLTVPVVLTKDWSDAALVALGAMSARNNLDPVAVLMMMGNESGLNASAVGKTSDGTPFAYGISQIHDLAGVGFKGAPADFVLLSPEQQVPFTDAFYQPHKNQTLNSLERLYQANFLPATLGWGSDLSLVLAKKGGGSPRWTFALSEAAVYRDNAGLDHGNKGFINVGDLGIAARASAGPRVQEAIARLKALGGVVPPSVNHGMGLIAGIVAGVMFGAVAAGGLVWATQGKAAAISLVPRALIPA